MQVEADLGHFIHFAVSIGLETRPLTRLEEMIKQADINLCEAKKSGKNRVVAYLLETAA